MLFAICIESFVMLNTIVLYIYSRNKDTLWGIVDWLCNASMSCIRSYYMKRQNAAGLVTISVTYA